MSKKHSEALMKGWEKRKIPDIDRFNSKINKQSNGCWNWTGSFFKDDLGNPSYGAFSLRIDSKQSMRKANRQAWRYFKNEEPGEMLVLHTCDNKACVNPDHLYLGTHQQNMQDSRDRGTHASGLRHHNFVRTDVLIDRIRDLRRQKVPKKEIMAWLNVGHGTIYRVSM